MGIRTIVEAFRAKAMAAAAPAPEADGPFTPSVPGPDVGMSLPVYPGTLIEDCVGQPMGLTCVDGAGTRTRRRFSLSALYRRPDGRLLLDGYCHERGARRAIPGEWIEEVVDLENGERTREVDAFLAALIPDDAEGRALRQCRAAVQVLVFLAACDGRFDRVEREVIVDYVLERVRGLPCDRAILAHRVAHVFPDHETFRRALVAIEGWPEGEIRRLVAALNRLADADTVFHEAEEQWLGQIEAALGTAG